MKFFIIFFTLLSISLSAQDFKKTGLIHLNKLSSNEFYGRGYVKNGYELAIKYVEAEFDKLGLQKISDSYRQPFSYPVNTFPDTVQLAIDEKILVPGESFLVLPESGSAYGNFDVRYLTMSDFYTKNRDKTFFSANEVVVVAPLSPKLGRDTVQYINDLLQKINANNPIIELTSSKLTWSVGKTCSKNARIQLTEKYFEPSAKQIKINVQNKLNEKFESYNLIAIQKAKKKKSKDYLIITAHLDHLGMMGSTATFNGANDNASGVSMLLTLADYYSKHPLKRKNIVFIAFGGEEAGLIGSKYFVDHPLIDLKKIKFLMNIDLMGNGEDGITVVNATKFAKEFENLKNINNQKNYLKLVKPRGEAANSDHYWFTKNDVPSFFIYTLGGTTAYHDIYDRAEQLPMTEFDDICKLIIDFFSQLK